jgi:hypothetical protein
MEALVQSSGIHVGFVMDKVALGQDLLSLPWFPLPIFISPMLQSCIYDTSTLPSNCNIYFIFICSFTQHILALISHNQVYFISLKLLPVLILLSSYIAVFSSVNSLQFCTQVLCLKVFLKFLKFLKSFLH